LSGAAGVNMKFEDSIPLQRNGNGLSNVCM
jgi:hypothetical protein